MKETAQAYLPPPRRFVPEDVDPGRWEDISPLFEELENRVCNSVEELERWILDVSELESIVFSQEARRYIAMSCHTDDEQIKEEYLRFSRDIDPRAKIAFDRLDRAYLNCPFRAQLPQPRFEVFDRVKVSDAEIFCQENVPLETTETELATEYTQLMGSLTVEIDGEEVPLAKAALELEEPDRGRRERAWRKITHRRYEERQTIEDLFSRLLALRKTMAANANFADYRELRFRRFRRFDYGVPQCKDYHDAASEVVLPAIRQLDEERCQKLGIESLTPWDLDVDPYSPKPFRPFKNQRELCDIARGLFRAVNPHFGTEFSVLEKKDLLDLFSRPNKAPGGYQYFLEDIRMPFIFANAAGNHEDVQTLLHEGGHAFHSLASRDEPISLYRDPPLEFCEVASMGMEFLGLEHLEQVYPAEIAYRVRCSHLERTLRLLSWIATVDAFQHWVYTTASDGPAARRAEWMRLRKKYAPGVDWSGLEKLREVQWHRQGHIFRQPFYYIEYGIALIGALQIWSRFRNDRESAISDYRKALALGGSRPLPELFGAAGLRFEFGANLLGPLVEEVKAEWNRLRREL